MVIRKLAQDVTRTIAETQVALQGISALSTSGAPTQPNADSVSSAAAGGAGACTCKFLVERMQAEHTRALADAEVGRRAMELMKERLQLLSDKSRTLNKKLVEIDSYWKPQGASVPAHASKQAQNLGLRRSSSALVQNLSPSPGTTPKGNVASLPPNRGTYREEARERDGGGLLLHTQNLPPTFPRQEGNLSDVSGTDHHNAFSASGGVASDVDTTNLSFA